MNVKVKSFQDILLVRTYSTSKFQALAIVPGDPKISCVSCVCRCHCEKVDNDNYRMEAVPSSAEQEQIDWSGSSFDTCFDFIESQSRDLNKQSPIALYLLSSPTFFTEAAGEMAAMMVVFDS